MNRRANPALFVGCVAVHFAFAGIAVATGPSVEPCKVLQSFAGEGPTDEFGDALDTVGDLDGDGVAELVVGAPHSATGGVDAGKVFVYSGATGALLFTVTGQPSELVGFSVAGIGDLSGDGVPDVVVGAPGTNGLVGRVTVRSGADGSLVFDLFGEGAADGFGASVATAGDVDGDGLADFLVGAPAAGPAGAGRAYVFSGASGAILRTLDGEAAGDGFGRTSGFLGDADGDGVGEVLVGANDAGPAHHGKVYVFSGASGALLFPLEGGATSLNFGISNVSGAGDVNGDGVPDVYVADWNDNTYGEFTGRATVFSGADGSTLLTWVGGSRLDALGNGGGVGDVDGDGHADLIIGEFLRGSDFGGRFAIYSGRDGSRLRAFTGAFADARLGTHVLTLGDVDGDGSTDYVASTQADAGHVFVISGGAVLGRPSPHVAGSPSTVRLTGCLPGARVVLAGSTRTGATPISRCPGRTLGLRTPRALRPVVADANGNAEFHMVVPASLSGRTVSMQALELPQCRLTDVVSVTFL